MNKKLCREMIKRGKWTKEMCFMCRFLQYLTCPQRPKENNDVSK